MINPGATLGNIEKAVLPYLLYAGKVILMPYLLFCHTRVRKINNTVRFTFYYY